MKNNLFLTSLNDASVNHLRSIKDNLYYELRNYKNYPTLPHYPIIDDFFDLYLNTLEYSPQQIVDMFNPSATLVDFLFSSSFSMVQNRDSWITNFKDLLDSDKTFFNKAFSTCLETHHYLYNLSSNNGIDDEPTFIEYKNSIIERNKKLFLSLIDIGQKNNHFSSFQQSDFFTKNTIYSQLIKDAHIFDDSLSIFDLNNFLDKDFNSDSGKNNSDFIATYISQIINYDNDTFTDLIFLLSRDNTLGKFINLIFSEKHLCDLDKLDNFIILLLNNEKAHKFIMESNSAIIRIMWDHPQCFKTLIDNMSEYQRNQIFSGIEVNASLIDSYGLTISKWWKDIFVDKYNRPNYHRTHIDDQVFDIIFNNIKTYNAVDSKAYHNYIGRVLIKYLHDFHTVEEDVKKFGYCSNIQTVKNNIESISHVVNFSNISYNASYKRCNVSGCIDSSLLYIKHHDSLLEEKAYDKISSNVGLQIYQFFYQLSRNEVSHYEIRDTIYNIANFIKSSSMYSCLDLLHADDNNPLWASIDLDLELDTKTRVKKFKDNYPLAFTLCELTRGAALSWFIEEGKLEHFSKVKYKAKTFISYFSSEEWFPKILTDLIEGPNSESANHKNVLQSLIYSQKPAIKTLDKFFENPHYANLKRTFNFHKLNESIHKESEKKTETIVKKNKI